MRARLVRRAVSIVVVAACGSWLAVATASASPAAGTNPEAVLAQRYAPVLRLVDQPGPCVKGEPYQPTNVNAVLGSPDVALRGPWDSTNIVKVGPTAQELSAGLQGYNLDFPGNALNPGCGYADWAARIAKTSPPTMYAHVATEASHPDHLALQYWFFYLFNDFNDKHEGDWEMIQLNFHAASVSDALAMPPYDVGFSQHEGAERADWGSSKLQIVDGTHPVVFPALGSHANYYSSGLHLGRSAAQGVGCDNTEGPTREVRPGVVVIPQFSAQYLAQLPWLGYLGRWGERHPGFYNGPTGPNAKQQWASPFTWVDTKWRDTSYAVPDGGRLGHAATGIFCTAVATGSNVLTLGVSHPTQVFLAILALLVFLGWLATRTRWGPATPFRLRRRRAWGALVTSSFRLYTANPRVFLGIGLLFIPLGLITAGVQYLLFDVGSFAPLVQNAGESNSFVAALVLSLGLVFTLLGLTITQAAVAVAVVELDEGRAIRPRAAFGRALAQARVLLGSLVVAVAAVALLGATGVGAIIGVWLAIRWSMLAQSIMMDDASRSPLTTSAEVTRGHWWRTASITFFVTVVGLLLGPLLGAVMLLVTNASFVVVNMIAAVIDVVVLPFVAITTTYLYVDLVVRDRIAAQQPAAAFSLPAEA